MLSQCSRQHKTRLPVLHNSSQLVCSEIKFVKALVSCSLSPPSLLPSLITVSPNFPAATATAGSGHRGDAVGSERGATTARGSAWEWVPHPAPSELTPQLWEQPEGEGMDGWMDEN